MTNPDYSAPQSDLKWCVGPRGMECGLCVVSAYKCTLQKATESDLGRTAKRIYGLPYPFTTNDVSGTWNSQLKYVNVRSL